MTKEQQSYQFIKRPNGQYRLLTEKECWRLQGYGDEDYEAALKVNPGRIGFKNNILYRQAGNSIPVPIFEEIFLAMRKEKMIQEAVSK